MHFVALRPFKPVFNNVHLFSHPSEFLSQKVWTELGIDLEQVQVCNCSTGASNFDAQLFNDAVVVLLRYKAIVHDPSKNFLANLVPVEVNTLCF
jgi:hypothetical protein